ncbi:MAG: roadblock/LC7 domain-containing protein [Candidatus Schekmanbacteria bacterium]|nr:roadblock/LC7 domain-containing protein [Candidatus Schekmanbacteria bacterium]
MDFKSGLEQILERVAGSLGASLIGADGLSVTEVSRDAKLDLTSIAAEYSTILKNARRAVDAMSFGVLEEIAVVTESFALLLCAVTDEYYLVLAIGRAELNYGKGRYELRRAIAQFRKELS